MLLASPSEAEPQYPRDAPTESELLDDSLQLPRISERVLYRHLRNLLLVSFLIHTGLQTLVREIYPSILDDPASTLRELYHCTFATQEQKILC